VAEIELSEDVTKDIKDFGVLELLFVVIMFIPIVIECLSREGWSRWKYK